MKMGTGMGMGMGTDVGTSMHMHIRGVMYGHACRGGAPHDPK